MAALSFEISRRVLLGGIGSAGIVKLVGLKRHSRNTSAEPADGSEDMTERLARKYRQKPISEILFTDIASFPIPDGVSEIRTAGYSAQGVGGGLYRSDDLAQQLATEHGRFCTTSRNGKVYRLVPENNAIAVEQAGAFGDKGDARRNDRPAFQAAIDYAREIGVETLLLTQPAYAIWMTVRSRPTFMWGAEGNGLVVAGNQRIRMVGTGSGRTRVRFRGPNGESFIDSRAVQNVYGQSWRGAGILLRTDPALAMSALTLENLTIETDYRRNPSGPADDLEWDITNKGVCTEPDKLGGDITILNCALIGWRGETVYCNNDPTRMLRIRGSTFSDSNAQGLNPNSLQVDIEDCEISNCRFGIEGWTGEAGGTISATIRDCSDALSIQGGKFGTSSRSAFNSPTRISGEDPIGQIDITCINSGRACLGWWLKGRLRLIDSHLCIGEPVAYADGSQWLDLDVSFEQRSVDTYMYIAGGSGEKGEMLTDNLDLRLSVVGSRVIQVLWFGSLGPNVRVSAGNSGNLLALKPAGPVLDNHPSFA